MNKKVKKLVPELRFSEFMGDWTESKFSNLIDLISGQHLSPNQYFLYSGEIPCSEEQEKIANFLTSIDKKVEALSLQIEKLEEFKKGLLQKMFV